MRDIILSIFYVPLSRRPRTSESSIVLGTNVFAEYSPLFKFQFGLIVYVDIQAWLHMRMHDNI